MKRVQNALSDGSGPFKSFIEIVWRPFRHAPAKISAIFILFVCLIAGAFISTRFLDSDIVIVSENSAAAELAFNEVPKIPQMKIEIPLDCTTLAQNKTCPTNYPTTFNPEDPNRSTCPDYFHWIHEDLRPWKDTGITRDMVHMARRTANFKLVILNGKAYVETYTKSFQSRDTFTLWGILQLLRRYPGQVPDLELMFDCVDWPVLSKNFYRGPNARTTTPPPLFRYCSNDASFDVVFPDWSFWGWPEINIKPWGSLLEDLKEGNKRTNWTDREPHAYWKGNPTVAATREDLMKCHVSETQDWGARVYAQDWFKESQEGYKQSDLASQCVDRYKIYIEGSAWSVSEKYILACNSLTFVVTPHYYDFFTRGLVPRKHYWPIKEDDKCRSIKFAIDWGNNNIKEAQEIGNAASEFIIENTKMDYVYDYMFHLLSEYAKLLRFKPELSANALELCSEKMACEANGLEKHFMLESMVKGPADTNPCILPPPYDPSTISSLRSRNEDSIKQVETWEKNFWENQKN